MLREREGHDASTVWISEIRDVRHAAPHLHGTGVPREQPLRVAASRSSQFLPPPRHRVPRTLMCLSRAIRHRDEVARLLASIR